MARAEKQVALTLEDRLEQVLVPDWEQPYKLPGNWVWTLGKSIFLPMETQKPFGDLFRYIDIDSIDNKNQIVNDPKILAVSKAPSRASRKISNGDTVFSMVRPYLKNIAYIDESLSDCIASTGFFVCHPTKPLNNRFIYWLMTSGYVVDGLNQHMKGDNSPSIRQGDIENFAYPIPPLAEQQRIVNRIESLFSKLDEAKEKARVALDSFEPRKAAILRKAFTGELTVKWREEHGVGIDSWERVQLQDVCEKIVCGKTPTGYISTNDEIPYLKVYNILNNQIDFETTPQFIPKEIHDRKLKSSQLRPHDVIMNIVGPPLRKIAIIPDTYPEWNMNQAIVRFRPKQGLVHKFLYYALVNPETLDDVINATKGVVGQANISITQSRNLEIYCPCLPEQAEVARILDDLFAKEQEAKDACTEILPRINLIKKSILARAFRGELGTNDPTEESAVELLKQCIALQTNEKGQTPKKKKAPAVVLSDEVRSQLSSKLERDIYLLLQKNGPTNMREIASISKKDLDVIEALRQLEKKGLIQKQSDGEYGCVR